MKICVLGAGGMLGADVVTCFSRMGHQVRGFNRNECDIADLQQVLEMLRKIGPDLVLNCAAYTDVDGAEANFEAALRVNALGVRNVAAACLENGAALVHISSDYVFDGAKREPYHEWDEPRPLGRYGASKYAGEWLVRSILPRHFIIRTQWLYGAGGKNFVTTILRAAREKGRLRVVDDQVGSPTYTVDLARAIEQLVREPRYGTYHITNSGSCSWHQFAREILQVAGLESIPVEPISSSELNRPAPRPAYSVLANTLWQAEGFAPLRHYRDAMADFLRAIGKRSEPSP